MSLAIFKCKMNGRIVKIFMINMTLLDSIPYFKYITEHFFIFGSKLTYFEYKIWGQIIIMKENGDKMKMYIIYVIFDNKNKVHSIK